MSISPIHLLTPPQVLQLLLPPKLPTSPPATSLTQPSILAPPQPLNPTLQGAEPHPRLAPRAPNMRF